MHRIVAQEVDQQRDGFNFRKFAAKASPVADPKSDGVVSKFGRETAACLRDEGLLAVWLHKAPRVETFGILPIARVIVYMPI